MTHSQAEKTANVLLAAAAVGVAVFVLRDPGRRRAAWGLVTRAVAAGVPWLVAETRRAWASTAHADASIIDTEAVQRSGL